MRKLILIRAVSGAGKSTFAETFAPDSCICCADDYFTDGQGNYNFDASKLGQAHKACQEKYLELLDSPFVDTIVVSNTNTKESDYKFYLDEAEKRGITEYVTKLTTIGVSNKVTKMTSVQNLELEYHELKNSMWKLVGDCINECL
jgi:predicted kinase